MNPSPTPQVTPKDTAKRRTFIVRLAVTLDALTQLERLVSGTPQALYGYPKDLPKLTELSEQIERWARMQRALDLPPTTVSCSWWSVDLAAVESFPKAAHFHLTHGPDIMGNGCDAWVCDTCGNTPESDGFFGFEHPDDTFATCARCHRFVAAAPAHRKGG